VPSAIDSPIWGMITSVMKPSRMTAFSGQRSAVNPERGFNVVVSSLIAAAQ